MRLQREIVPRRTILLEAYKFSNLSRSSSFSSGSFHPVIFSYIVSSFVFPSFIFSIQTVWFFLLTSLLSTSVSHNSDLCRSIDGDVALDIIHHNTFFLLKNLLLVLGPWDFHPFTALHDILDRVSVTLCM